MKKFTHDFKKKLDLALKYSWLKNKKVKRC